MSRSREKNRFVNKILTVLFSLLVCGLVVREAYLIFSVPFAVGIDGYYYVLQITSFFAEGSFYFPTITPLVHYWGIILNDLLHDPIISSKVCALLLSLFLLLAIMSVTWLVSESFLFGAIGAALFKGSGLSLYLSVEYVNQLGSLAFLLWSGFFLFLAVKAKRIWLGPVVIVLLVLSLLSHRSAAPMALSVGFAFAFLWALNSEKVKTNKVYRYSIYTLFFAVLIVPAIVGFLAPGPLPLILRDGFTIIPSFPSHFATLPEMIILLVLVPATVYLLLKDRTFAIGPLAKYFVGTLVVWTLLTSLNPFISSQSGFVGMGGRLRVLACVQVAFLVPVLIMLIREHRPKIAIGIAIFVSPFLIWSFLSPVPAGVNSSYLHQRGRLIDALTKNPAVFTDADLIVADHGEQFVVTQITGKPSAQRLPARTGNYKNIYWLINGVPVSMVDDNMSVLFGNGSGQMTVLVKHDERWQKRLGSLDLRRIAIMRNPHLYEYLKGR